MEDIAPSILDQQGRGTARAGTVDNLMDAAIVLDVERESALMSVHA